LVLWARLELARLAPLPPQDSVSTNSTTRAKVVSLLLIAGRFFLFKLRQIKRLVVGRLEFRHVGNRHFVARFRQLSRLLLNRRGVLEQAGRRLRRLAAQVREAQAADEEQCRANSRGP